MLGPFRKGLFNGLVLSWMKMTKNKDPILVIYQGVSLSCIIEVVEISSALSLFFLGKARLLVFVLGLMTYVVLKLLRL